MPSSVSSQRSPIDGVIEILDCPTCRRDHGLVVQEHAGAQYLACPLCEFWYPVVDEVLVLLPSDRVSGGLRRPLGPAVPCRLELSERRSLDMKSVVYSYFARMHELSERFSLLQQPLVVDIGCSTGSLSCALGTEQSYFGLDISIRSLTFARRSTGRFFAQADAERLPLKSASVGFFVSREVLEHLDNPAAGARELRRVGQRGVIETPNLDFPFLYDPLNYMLTRFGKRAKFGIYGYDHHELRSVAGWRELIEQASFHVEREAPIGTGLALNGSDIFWHAVSSWRKFDNLPRSGVSPSLAAKLFKLYQRAHAVDRLLYPYGCSQAYAVS
jgi:SAM-dependent methyltransferase